MELQESTNRLVELIRHSQSPYHTMKEAISQLEKAGFERISLAESAALEPGKAYYVSIYDRSLAAFRVPQSGFKGFRIITSHIDNPCFMIKPNPERKKSDCITLNVERYGGPILNTWLDRPLTIAGRVCVATDDPFNPKTMLYNSKKPVAVIPNLAIHMNREVNKGVELKVQTDLEPIVSLIGARKIRRDGFLERSLQSLALRQTAFLIMNCFYVMVRSHQLQALMMSFYQRQDLII